jgi:hypothetical protein
MKSADQYIPIQPGQEWMIAGQNNLINDLLGQVGYVPHDGFVMMTEDVTQTRDTKYVDMKLVVMDAEKYSDWDVLPLPADMAADVVQEAFKILAAQFPPDDKVDSSSVENPERR